MRSFLFLILLFSITAHAGLEKITIQNLDLNYETPFGKGSVDRLGIGMGVLNDPFELEVHRLANSFEITSPYVDFSWNRPNAFIHNVQKLTAKKTSASLGSVKHHFIDSEHLMVKPEGRGEYHAKKLKGNCEGSSEGSFKFRLMNDCRKKMDLTIGSVDIPTDFILYKVLEDLPTLPDQEIEIPGDNVIVSSRDGNYSLQIYVKYWIRAGLRSWGHVRYENNFQTVAIRVDQIKFGYLNVTNLVMRKLKELVTNPNVKVDPPWIRVNIAGPNEIKSN
jgi:hypothetical protein